MILFFKTFFFLVRGCFVSPFRGVVSAKKIKPVPTQKLRTDSPGSLTGKKNKTGIIDFHHKGHRQDCACIHTHSHKLIKNLGPNRAGIKLEPDLPYGFTFTGGFQIFNFRADLGTIFFKKSLLPTTLNIAVPKSSMISKEQSKKSS